jgi:hypothetical protein
MKKTFYITPPDSDDLCSIWLGKWDVTMPIEEAFKAWPCVALLAPSGRIGQYTITEEEYEILIECMPLKPGMTITVDI